MVMDWMSGNSPVRYCLARVTLPERALFWAALSSCLRLMRPSMPEKPALGLFHSNPPGEYSTCRVSCSPFSGQNTR